MVSAVARRAAAGAARFAELPRARLAERRWPPYSRLLLVGEDAPWVIAREAAEVTRVARRLGVEVAPGRWHRYVERQSIFYGSQFALQRGIPSRPHNRIGVSYFHGRPGTPGAPEFDETYESIRRHHRRIERVQVSHVEMRDILAGTGIEPAKLFLIPIGVDLDLFRPAPEEREALRRRYRIPAGAVVVGSFQKDGVGWGEGDEPKSIKGPDVFVDVLERVAAGVPELFALLTGPARGYVKRRLAQAGIPYRHVYANAYEELPGLYGTLDAYLIASRQEGGPKALLESMAVGVPVVTTRVGQAADLAVDGENAIVTAVDDIDALAGGLLRVLADRQLAARLTDGGFQLAHATSYRALESRWAELFAGFVDS